MTAFLHRVRMADGSATVPAPLSLPVVVDQCARMLAEAEAQAGQMRTAAMEAGRREGLQKARQESMELLTGLRDLVQALAAERATMVRAAEAEIAQLVVDATRQLLHAELATRPQVILDLIRPAIERVADPSRLRLRLHPADLALLRQQAAEGAVTLPDAVADDTLGRGDCMVDTTSGVIDARVDTLVGQLQARMRP